MALNVVFSNVWGIILKEWKGCSAKTIAVLLTGIADGYAYKGDDNSDNHREGKLRQRIILREEGVEKDRTHDGAKTRDPRRLRYQRRVLLLSEQPQPHMGRLCQGGCMGQ